MKKTHQNISIIFDKCEVVRKSGADIVMFTIASKNLFGVPIRHLQDIHNGYEEYNSRCMTIQTVYGNGPNLARLLAWCLRIDIIDTNDLDHPLKFIDSWDPDCAIIDAVKK